MLRLNKNKNILHTLHDRELNSVSTPYKLSLHVIRQIIQSDQSSYTSNWSYQSSKLVTYDSGFLYLHNHGTSYTVYGDKCDPSFAYNHKPGRAKKKIQDVITYSSPVIRNIEPCACCHKHCTCLSKYIICITEDHWLCQCHLDNGLLIREVYIKRLDSNIKFKYCDWNVYGEQVILTSCQNPDSLNSDVVVNLAVFTVYPFDFKALLEIKRSIFGKSCKHVNVSDQLLVLGMGYDRVYIYSFPDILAEGTSVPFKLGDRYSKTVRVGMYPFGLPLNCTIHSAPPLLFNVPCFGQTVNFGGFPYHCIYSKTNNQTHFVIKDVKNNISSAESHVYSNVWGDEPDIVYFHPDNSNRIISRELLRVVCYDILNCSEQFNLKEAFVLGFPYTDKVDVPEFSSFGRKINRKQECNILVDKCIMATDFDDELDLVGILGVSLSDPLHMGYIKLYDSFTGKEVKCIGLDKSLCETNYYQLRIDLDILIVIEKDEKNKYVVHTYRVSY